MRLWLWALLTLLPLPAAAAAVMEGTQPWPKGEVPYRIAPSLLKAAGAAGKDCAGWTKWHQGQAFKACKAMNEWQLSAGIRFVAADRLDTVNIVDGTGKATDGTLGRMPMANRVRIEARASYGSVLHEFGHVLGLMHEHQRPDRDQYLKLAPFLQTDLDTCGLRIDAVCNDVRMAFPVVKVQMSSGYDPCSLMHYLANQTPRHRDDPRWGRIFALTAKGEKALKLCLPQFAKLPSRCRKVGQKCTISADDAAIVRRFNGV